MRVMTGPTKAEMLRAIEFSGDPAAPVLLFSVADKTGERLLETQQYRIIMIETDRFIVIFHDEEQYGRELVYQLAG